MGNEDIRPPVDPEILRALRELGLNIKPDTEPKPYICPQHGPVSQQNVRESNGFLVHAGCGTIVYKDPDFRPK